MHEEYFKIENNIHKELGISEDRYTRAFFLDAQGVFCPDNFDCNINTNFGITDFKMPLINYNKFEMDLNLQSMTAYAMLGMKGSAFGIDINASVCKGAVSFTPTIGNRKLQITFEGIIGEGISILAGTSGFKLGIAAGYGGSVLNYGSGLTDGKYYLANNKGYITEVTSDLWKSDCKKARIFEICFYYCLIYIGYLIILK